MCLPDFFALISRLQSLPHFWYNDAMTATEKYLAMNNEFCRLRDAIFNPDVDEAEEDEQVQQSVQMALGILVQYLDYYKDLNKVRSREKKS